MGKQSKSNLPADFFTNTGGSNYGLDGYHFNQDYEEGLLDRARLPEVAGLGGLPDGFIQDSAEHSEVPVEAKRATDAHFDLSEMLKESSVANLDWLDFTSQNPDRLPKQPVDRMVQELSEAWGVDQRTDGLRLLPNRDKEILDYEESLLEEGFHKKKASPEDLLRVSRRAMRRSMAGVPLNELCKEALDSLPGSEKELAPALQAIQEEHGLLGNVFIRAASLPKCHNGKWAKTVKKVASEAQFVVAKKECESCIHNMNGRCASFKKEVVWRIPWQDALDHYRPLLRSQGRKVASTGNPQEILKAAFTSEAESSRRSEHKPIVVPVSDQITLQAAREEFNQAPEPNRVVVDRVAQEQEVYRNKVNYQINKWAKSGILSKKDAKRLLGSSAEPRSILDTAMSIVASTKKPREYAGTLFEKFSSVTAATAWKNLKRAEDEISREREKLARDLSKRTESRLVDMQNVGLITKEECQKLIRYAKDHTAEKSLELAFALVAKKSSHAIKIPLVEKAPVYSGEGIDALWLPELREASDHLGAKEKLAQREHSMMGDNLDRLVKSGMITLKESQKLMDLGHSITETMKLASALIADRQMNPVPIKQGKQARMFKAQGPISDHIPLHENKDPQVNTLAVVGLLKWAGRHLNEGVLGHELDQMLSARFSQPMLKAASAPLQKLRDQHEGAAGHMYVDSSIYASKKGVTGCEEGALRHRANGIKLILAMNRCGSCVFNNADGVCQKYNKMLIDKIPKEASQYKEEMKRLANSSDAEVTASLFQPADHSVYEYGVANNNLNDFSFDVAVSNEDLGRVLFGGMDLGDD